MCFFSSRVLPRNALNDYFRKPSGFAFEIFVETLEMNLTFSQHFQRLSPQVLKNRLSPLLKA
jgi:hypothetical protein